ncbi:bis-aminopropyl spermidine synthase family protein [Allosalinactinospora lopnorensis]|uniref:bis-aminopropyl spermidine synthase family protein n=1 Tax=Allosalinactinospora lopnorensis TaxID=1352348 RepID=UPI000623E532|nr:bis-aminopropyl spermidine synthase family protein [Allosalinactinospora lopnorensis]
MIDPPPKLADLLKEQGINAPRVHRVLAALANGAWWSPPELVRETAVAHRLVAATLDALADELEHRQGNEGLRVRLLRPADHADSSAPEPADPVAHLLDRHTEAAAELDRLVAEAPRSRRDLDHVAATAHTALRRGVLLATRYSLPGTRLLCVGDHDLTALATTLVCPGAEAVVVDVDERVLDYIDQAAARLGLPVRCHFADLRLGLPASVRGQCDLAFTDPPYTTEGVELFVRRGLEGLADPRRGRVLLAYGASESTPALIAKTQSRLARMNLVFEAVWPEFNRYLGAEAIGAASDLYVLCPTSRTPAGDASDTAGRIYSQGGNAKEAAGGLEAPSAAAVLRRVGPDTVVGAWSREAPPEEGARCARVRLATWLGSPSRAERAAVDLTGGWEALLARAILAGGSAETHVVVPSGAPQVRDEAGQEALRAMVAPGRDVRFLRGFPDSGHTLVVARRCEPSDGASPDVRLLAHCQDRAHGVLTSTLREGLIAVAASLGRPVNKKGARGRVAAAAPWLSGHTLLDLPAHRFPALGSAAERLVAELP